MNTLALPAGVPIHICTPVYTNTPIEPTQAFNNFVNDIIETIPYLTSSMSYEPKTFLL